MIVRGLVLPVPAQNSAYAFRKANVGARVSERLEKRLFEPRTARASYELCRGPGLVVPKMAFEPGLANHVRWQLA